MVRVLKGMMYNPLNCAIIVGLYRDTYKSGKPIPHTQTELYTKLTWCLLLRYLKVIEHPLASKLPDKLENLQEDDSYLYQQLVKIGKLAFVGKKNYEVIFKKLPEGCSDLGLLVKHTSLYTAEESITYNFFHLTLQEYMSAFYISQLPADEQSTAFFSTSMGLVWRFVAGLTKMQNIGWYEIEREERNYMELYSWKEDDKDEVDDDVMIVGPVLLECLYEAQDMQSCECAFGRCRVNNSREYLLSNYGLYACWLLYICMQ